jgi:hypothetical protein
MKTRDDSAWAAPEEDMYGPMTGGAAWAEDAVFS